MAGLIPLLLALLIADHGARNGDPSTDWVRSTAQVLLLALGWWLLCEGIGRAILRWGNRRVLDRWDQLGETGALGLYAMLVLGFGWAAQAHSYCMAVAPWLLLQCIQWWAIAPALRRAGSPWSRAGLLWHRLRFGVLPVALVLPIIDVCDRLARSALLAPYFSGTSGDVLNGIGMLLLGVFMVTLMPAALVWLWGGRDLPPGPLRDLLADGCARSGIPPGRLMRWPSPGGRLYNAAVLGVLPRLRFILFSDDLLRDLPPGELRAVLGHELGHVRHHHLWIYLVFLVAMALSTAICTPPCLELAQLIPGAGDISPGMIKLAVAVLLFGLHLRLAFGVLSRACERQADLAGATLAGDGDTAAGCRTMCAALKSVAYLSGTREDAPSWRHHSIAQRIAFLERVAQEPDVAADHHQRVRRMRYGLIFLVIAMGISLAAQVWLDPLRPARDSSDPTAQLKELSQAQPVLGHALRRADQGDPSELGTWLNRASGLDRQRLGVLLLRSLSEAQGEHKADMREAWRQRFRLIPFSLISTENSNLDFNIDNFLAYILMAGNEAPEQSEMTLALGILPRLEKAMLAQPLHEVWDTIGCVRHRMGDYGGASKAFSNAIDLIAKEKPSPALAEAQALYRRRLDAAAASSVPGARPVPLPLEWDVVPPEVPTRPMTSASQAHPR